MFGLQLDQHDINHMYSLCGKKRSNYYLKVGDMRVRLISCRSNSNKNSAREYVRVHGKWFASDVPPLLSWREVGSFRSIVYSPFPFIIVLFTRILTRFLFFFFFFIAVDSVFNQDIRTVHVRDLNFVLRSEIFVHWDR